MHLALALCFLLASFIWVDWKNWKEFLPTVYYMSSMNLTYQFIAHSKYHLWEYERHLFGEIITDIIYTWVVFPCTVLLLLSGNTEKKTRLILKWVFIYSLIEWIGSLFGFISYHHGWSLILSIAFNFLMFSMLLLHYKRPLVAISISPVVAVVLVLIFF